MSLWQVQQATNAVAREQQLKEELRNQLVAAAADSKRKVWNKILNPERSSRPLQLSM
jgi:flagellar biosynthesis/type III secretory pathway protein FliH